MELRLGFSYRSRAGERVKLTGHGSSPPTFYSESGRKYKNSGAAYGDNATDHDLIAVWLDEPAKLDPARIVTNGAYGAYCGSGDTAKMQAFVDYAAKQAKPVTLSPTWEVMDPADAVHDLERIPLPDGRVYARRVVVPVMGELAITGFHANGNWAFGAILHSFDTHRITLPTRDGALIAGTYTSADGHSVVVGVV